MKIQIITLKTVLICLFTSTIFLLSSCVGDPIDHRLKFLGTYSITEACDSGDWSFTSTITEKITDDNEVNISNFGNYDVTVTATIYGSKITVNDEAGGYEFSGTGSIEGNVISFNYTTILPTGSTDECDQTCTQQQ